MYKKQKRTLKSVLNSNVYNDELFSRSSMTTIIRALLEPVANQNAVSLMFTRFKNKEGLEGLIKRLEYCNNVEMVDVTTQGLLIKDDYVELEFVIFTSARYNFVLLWDYSIDGEKNYTKGFFLANSRGVNDIYEILQSNLSANYREKFYLHKPERRENELLNEALFNVFKKLNNSIEESAYRGEDNFVVDLDLEDDNEEKIKETCHEIKNQLSILDVYSKVIEKQFGKSKNTDAIKKAVSIIALQLNELRNFEEPPVKELILQEVLKESAGLFSEVVKENNNEILIEKVPSYDIKIFAAESKLLSVFNNLIKNANESTTNDKIEIEVELEGNFARIDFINHGVPVEEGAKKRIFEKGFTTKSKGSGFGLYSSKNYIESLSGELNLFVSDEEKTIFRINLPIN